MHEPDLRIVGVFRRGDYVSQAADTDRQRRPPSCPQSILSNRNRRCTNPSIALIQKQSGEHLHLGKGDVRVNKSVSIALTSIFARGRGRPDAPEGAAASGKALGEAALLSPDEALQRLSAPRAASRPSRSRAASLGSGRNQVAHEARHTILGEIVGRSINPLNLLLLSLAIASYVLGDHGPRS